MTSAEKKAFLLLKCVIFHYHGLDKDEQRILDETAQALQAQAELDWANQFVAEDYYNAFERARSYLAEAVSDLDKPKRLDYLLKVWNANLQKGYISEMEAMALLKIAKDWGVEEGLIESIKKIKK
jgi:hypothetical protein